MRTINVKFIFGDVQTDVAAELSSEWFGGPYVAVSRHASQVRWPGPRLCEPVVIYAWDVIIEALIIEEAYEAMHELEEMAQNGEWELSAGMEWFRLQRHERLPMIPQVE